MSAKSTKKADRERPMREHYDFSEAKRGRFPDLAGAHLVLVAHDVWTYFGSERAVLAALRGLVRKAKPRKARTRRARRAA